MNRSSKLFFILATVIAVAATYNFTTQLTTQKNETQNAEVLGEKDSLESEIDASLSELDLSFDEVLDSKEADTIENEAGAKETENNSDEHQVESGQETGNTDLEEHPDPTNVPAKMPMNETYRVSKIKKLFLLIPIKIDTVQTISDSGVVLDEKRTLVGNILDIFSF